MILPSNMWNIYMCVDDKICLCCFAASCRVSCRASKPTTWCRRCACYSTNVRNSATAAGRDFTASTATFSSCRSSLSAETALTTVCYCLGTHRESTLHVDVDENSQTKLQRTDTQFVLSLKVSGFRRPEPPGIPDVIFLDARFPFWHCWFVHTAGKQSHQ